MAMETLAESNVIDGKNSMINPMFSMDLHSHGLLSHEAQMHIHLLSTSLMETERNQKSNPGSYGSRSSRNSRKSKHSSGNSLNRSRKTKKRSEKPRSSPPARKTVPSKAAPSPVAGSVLQFPTIPSSNEVWNRMNVRQLNKAQKMRQNTVNLNVNKKEIEADPLVKAQILLEAKQTKCVQEQHLDEGSCKPKVRIQDHSGDTSQSDLDVSDTEESLETPRIPGRRNFSESKADAVLPYHQEALKKTVDGSGGCYAGALKLIKCAFETACLPRKSVDKKLVVRHSPLVDNHGDQQLRKRSVSFQTAFCQTGEQQVQKRRGSKQTSFETVPLKAYRQSSDEAVAPITTKIASTSELPANQGRRSSKGSSGSDRACKVGSDDTARVVSVKEFKEASGVPSLPKELLTLLDGAQATESMDLSMPAMLKLLAQHMQKPKIESTAIIPTLLQLVILCEHTHCLPTFMQLGGKETLMCIVNKSAGSDAVLIKIMVGAVFSLLIRQKDGSQLCLSSNGQVDKHVVLLLLQCIVDLDTCSPMARAAVPICLTAIFTCLVTMLMSGYMLPLQLLTKGTLRRCLKLLEAARDFKNSKDLTETQHSAFLTAGLQFLAVIAKKGSDNIRKLLIKEHVVYRTLSILSESGDQNYSEHELAAVKGLISCLCSRSELATSQLSDWICANSESTNSFSVLAVEVGMACLGHGLFHIGRERSQQGRAPIMKKRSGRSLMIVSD